MTADDSHTTEGPSVSEHDQTLWHESTRLSESEVLKLLELKAELDDTVHTEPRSWADQLRVILIGAAAGLLVLLASQLIGKQGSPDTAIIEQLRQQAELLKRQDERLSEYERSQRDLLLRLLTRSGVPAAEPAPKVADRVPRSPEGPEAREEPRDSYVVKDGDTLASIARRRQVAVDAIVRMNPDLPKGKETKLRPGMAISVPAASTVRITGPFSGDQVDYRQTVFGFARNGAEQITVIVHPQETEAYWVQPAPSVDADGNFSALAHFGEPSEASVGKRFDVRAFVGTSTPLKSGDVLSGWPTARAASDTVVVTRR